VCTYLSRSSLGLCLCLGWRSSNSRLLAILLRKLDGTRGTLWSEEVAAVLTGLQRFADVHVDSGFCHIAQVVVGKDVLLNSLTAGEENVSDKRRRDAER